MMKCRLAPDRSLTPNPLPEGEGAIVLREFHRKIGSDRPGSGAAVMQINAVTEGYRP